MTQGEARVTSEPGSHLETLVRGRNAAPFDLLGVHAAPEGEGVVVRAWVPGANSLSLHLGGAGLSMERVHDEGVFELALEGEVDADGAAGVSYLLSADGGEVFEDPYRFGPVHPEEELARARRIDGRAHQILGAHPVEHEGVQGTVFAVWAPAAEAVAVAGDFNDWSGRRHPMRARGSTGIWELFLPAVGAGALYKFHVRSRIGGLEMLKADPYGRAMELRPQTASVVAAPSRHAWGDTEWITAREERQGPDRPMSVYEVHTGSWRRHPEAGSEGGQPGWMTYRELAEELIPYVKEAGFTHVELLPVMEHPYDASWGYQTVGYFAPTARHGSADDLRALVDAAHAAGIGVLLDWVPAHFPRDAHALGIFDGSHLYEHADPRKGLHPDWGTYIFNYGRAEVAAFLASSALYWIEEFHVDGLRFDAVASMLYLDYSRQEGEWVPNVRGGRENLEAIDFLRDLNRTLRELHPGVLLMAEESTAWPGVTRAAEEGGLGFDVKWNLGWMHDTLKVMQADPMVRGQLYHALTFGLTYAWSERFLLGLSHDEVVHLKRSLLSKMPGETLDRFANLRLLYGWMWGHPGKKLLFMGGELGVWGEWSEEEELDWALLDEPMHRRLRRWVGELNALYARERALHERDYHPDGFEWLDCHDPERTTLSFVRWSADWEECVVVVCNFAAVAWEDFRLAVPRPGTWKVLLDSGAERYGGGGGLGLDTLETTEGELFGREQYIEMSLPPLAAIYLKPAGEAPARDERGPELLGDDVEA